MKQIRFATLIALVIGVYGLRANADINFEFDFTGSFVGNNAEQQAIITAGQLYSQQFGSYFSNSATITMTVNGYSDASSSVLASAGSSFVPGSTSPGLATEVILTKLQGGGDQGGGQPNGSVNVNFAYSYSLVGHSAWVWP